MLFAQHWRRTRFTSTLVFSCNQCALTADEYGLLPSVPLQYVLWCLVTKGRGAWKCTYSKEVESCLQSLFCHGYFQFFFFLQFVCINFFCPGLTWIAEIISYSLKVSYGHHVYVSQFTFPLQLLNALQVFKKSPLLVLTYILLKKFCVAGCHYVLRHLFHPRPGQEFKERTMVVQQD